MMLANRNIFTNSTTGSTAAARSHGRLVLDTGTGNHTASFDGWLSVLKVLAGNESKQADASGARERVRARQLLVVPRGPPLAIGYFPSAFVATGACLREPKQNEQQIAQRSLHSSVQVGGRGR
jgi:hypothetical protein